MQFTNRLNLPPYLLDWVKKDNYDHDSTPNTISATGLLKPVRVAILTQRYSDTLQMDVADLISSKYGTALHDSIEKIETPGVSKEVRTKRKITVDGVEFTISGKYDLLVDNGDGTHTIRDIKSTSVWAYIYGGKDKEYSAQLSIYKWLLSEDKTITDHAYIDFFFTDWSASKAKTEENYPQSRIQHSYRINLAPIEDTERAIRNRLKEILVNKDKPDDDLPYCTKEQLWAEDDKFALIKIGNKRATKVCDTEEEAINYRAANNLSASIEYRPGKVKRCIYCPALAICNQAKELNRLGLLDLA